MLPDIAMTGIVRNRGRKRELTTDLGHGDDEALRESESKRALVLAADSAVQDSRNRTQPLDLPTAILVAQRPGAKVFAVVRQDAIAPFAQAGVRPLHHLATIEAHRVVSYSDAMAVSETFERNVFHRP